jgi:hypothetical protein
MIDDRVPDPISKLGSVRDRPFEAAHFDRIEAARGASRGGRHRRQPAPRRRTGSPGRGDEASQDETDRPIGRYLDVTA